MARRIALAFVFTLAIVSSIFAADRPNIVWLSCEDISPHHFGCYGGKHAITPAIDSLAARGVRFTNAFTTHGVCAPSRTAIISGMMPTTLGANHMRSRAKLPDFVKGFPRYLRDAGYYCTNNVKTDYNFANFDAGWHASSNKAHWKHRPERDQPFFAVFNYTGTHESQVFASPEAFEKKVASLSPAERQDPAKLDVPPIYPDTPAIRRDQADYHELATVLDKWVAGHLKELEDAGLLDETIVFFWSDHGDGLPRSKRWLYDSGTRVPLIVWIPPKYRAAGQGVPGSVDDQLVSGIDFGPTVLNLAGVKVPEHMEGRAFLGANLTEPREYAYGARDRVDERYDLIRSVRDKRYLYIRNFMPWKPRNQHIGYAEQEQSMQELRRLEREGKLPDNCRWFNEQPKAAEELYDVVADPWQMNNLANHPAHAKTRDRMRQALRDWTVETHDTGFIPEAIMAEGEQQLGSRWAIFRQAGGDAPPGALYDLLSSDLPGYSAAVPVFDGPIARYWNVHRANFRGDAALGSPQEIASLLESQSEPIVRVTAAHWLALRGQPDKALPVLTAALKDKNEWVVLAALTALDEMGEAARSALEDVKALPKKMSEYPGRMRDSILKRFK